MKNITEKAPGKIMIAGEWGIIQPGNWCIVTAIDQYIYATISEHEEFCLHITERGVQIKCRTTQDLFSLLKNEKNLEFVREALRLGLHYVQEFGIAIQPFLLTIHADEYLAAQIKCGLGTSAAVTVAVIKAVLSFFAVSYNQELIFKLAAVAHLRVQKGKGSCFDIAASSYMTTIAYRSFDRSWVRDLLSAHILPSIVAMKWPLLEIKPCPWPGSLQLCIGWTGQAASTTACIDAISAWQQTDHAQWHIISQQINATVIKLINAFNAHDSQAILALITKNRLLLAQLAKQACVKLETDTITSLIDRAQLYGATAKFSGAGGGDCGIALCPNSFIAQKVKKAWGNCGIKALNLHPL